MIPLTRPPFTVYINQRADVDREKIYFKIYHAVDAVLGLGILSKGGQIKKFEDAVVKYVGTKYAIAVNSCTSGLQVVLEALDIGVRDKVVCPNFTYPSTKLVIENVGAMPKFIDVSDDYCSFSIEGTECDRHVGAIIHVDLFGNFSFGDDPISRPQIIRDSACGLGLHYRGANIWKNHMNDILVYSFHPRKIITTGEGGMICTNDEGSDRRLRQLVGYEDQVRKYNLRMSDVQATMGLVQMDYLDDIIADRQRAAKIYDDLIDDHLQGNFKKHPRQEGVNQTFQSYVGRIEYNLEAFRSDFAIWDVASNVIKEMRDKGIEVQRGSYFVPESTFSSKYKFDPLNGYKFARYCLALPMYYKITEDEQQTVITTLKEVLQ